MIVANRSIPFLSSFSRMFQNVRYLHSEEKLGMTRFLVHKQNCVERFSNLKDNFVNRLAANVASQDSREMIFTEDIKNLIYLMENTPEDTKLFKDVLTKYAQQNNDLRFSSFNFGSIISRAFYTFNASDALFELIQDEKINSLFSDQLFVYMIAMDLSYNNAKYDQVEQLYQLYLKNNTKNAYPRDLILILLASYYKQNSAESFEKAKTLMRDITSSQNSLSRKSVMFFAALAYRQQHYNEAFESLSLCTKDFFLSKNLRILILSKLGRFEDVITDLKAINESTVYKSFIIKEVAESIRNEVEKDENETLTKQIELLVKELAAKECILDKSFEACLDEPQKFSPRTNSFANNRNQNQNYRNNRFGNSNASFNRNFNNYRSHNQTNRFDSLNSSE